MNPLPNVAYGFFLFGVCAAFDFVRCALLGPYQPPEVTAGSSLARMIFMFLLCAIALNASGV